MNPNLIMAGFWLIVGVALVVFHAMNPDVDRGKIGGYSLGWVALIITLYNLARWRSTRSYEEDRMFEESQEFRRTKGRYSTIKPGEEAPDPNFDFSKGPTHASGTVQSGNSCTQGQETDGQARSRWAARKWERRAGLIGFPVGAALGALYGIIVGHEPTDIAIEAIIGGLCAGIGFALIGSVVAKSMLGTEGAFEQGQDFRRNKSRYSTLKPHEEPPDPNFDFSKEPPKTPESPEGKS